MIIEKKVLRNVSLTSHPAGCRKAVEKEVAWVQKHAANSSDSRYPAIGTLTLPKRVLVLGGSTGYGLSSRIVATFAGAADTIGVSFEREPKEKRTASPGWYNTHVFEELAQKAGRKAYSIFGDAFATETKEQVADLIRAHFGQIDLVVYSLASPQRTDPVTGEVYRSTLQPTEEDFTALSLSLGSDIVTEATVSAADSAATEATVKVMGGEDWQLWIEFLLNENLLAPGAKTIAYSYAGPELTYPIYRDGTIGKAKEHLQKTATTLNELLAPLAGGAYISVNKALVTRASAVIPIVPLYMALLYQVMQEQGVHEEPAQQIYRLFTTLLYSEGGPILDTQGRLRVDDWEMDPAIQAEVEKRWKRQREGEPLVGGDFALVEQTYDRIHGFGWEGIDYTKATDPVTGWRR